MIINERRYAAAWRTAGGEVKRFDDVGDLIACYRAQNPPENVSFWFHDYDSATDEVWLQSKDAFFVKSSRLRTPMGHGIVAVGSRSRATELARETDGSVVEFEEILHGR